MDDLLLEYYIIWSKEFKVTIFSKVLKDTLVILWWGIDVVLYESNIMNVNENFSK